MSRLSSALRALAPYTLAWLFVAACGGDDAGQRRSDGGEGPSDAAAVDASFSDAGVGSDAADAQLAIDAADDAASAWVDAAPELDSSVDAAVDANVEPLIDAGAPVPRFAATSLTTPPSYLGTMGGSSACAHAFRTVGHAPVANGSQKYPLFLYFVGTSGGPADESARFDGQAAQRVTKAMAERGFVALSVEYDNALFSIFTNKVPCLFGSDNAQSLFVKACASPRVDCSMGIATWGHSQGGLLAHLASNHDARVRAVWTTGYGGVSGVALPPNRFRTVNGEADAMNASVATANKTAGFTTADQCPDDGRDRCLRADGSGWIIVRKADCALNAADHCWFNKRSCAHDAETLEPNWVDSGAGKPFALDDNADWVARTVSRP